MTDLGRWTPFINEQELLGWYGLPAAMQREAAIYQPDGSELEALDDGDFAALRHATVAYANRSVAPYAPSYHNATHFRAVEEQGLAAADAYANGDERKMPSAVRQVFGLALYAHDAHHCASTFRFDARRGVYRPELGVQVSSEWVTALSLNEFMQAHGVAFPARLFQTAVVWASTFGGMTPAGRRLRLPNPEPSTIWGAIMRAADVCPTNSMQEQIRRGASINYGEILPTRPPRTVRAYIESEKGFMRYVESTFDRLDTLAASDLTRRLGWRSRLHKIHHGIARLEMGDRSLIALVRHEAGRYGVSL